MKTHRIGIIAPAGCIHEDRFHTGLLCLERMGWSYVLGEHVRDQHCELAGEDIHRAGDIQAALLDPSIDILWAARGGYGCFRTLLSWLECWPRVPLKPLLGFSDITVLHQYWCEQNAISIHVGNIENLNDFRESDWARLSALLTPKALPIRYPLRIVHNRAHAKHIVGRLLGGNLTVLASLCGTAYMPNWQNAIVFFEDIGEASYRVDRLLWQLYHAGHLAQVKAIILGQFYRCGYEGRSILDGLVAETLKKWEIPLAVGLEVGHEPCSLPLPLGREVVLDMTHDCLHFHA
jgi:muramoyltetrapeptide carboxypeptidase